MDTVTILIITIGLGLLFGLIGKWQLERKWNSPEWKLEVLEQSKHMLPEEYYLAKKEYYENQIKRRG